MESALQERFCCRNQNPVCTLSTSLSALPPGHSCPLAFHLPLAVGVPGTLPPRGLSTTPFHCSWLSLHAGGPCSSWGTPPQQSPEACRTQAAPRRHLLSRAVCGSFPSDPTPWGCLPFVAKTQPHFAINTTLTRGEYSSRKGILSPSSCPPLLFPPCLFPIA